jgi:hypothetical protein
MIVRNFRYVVCAAGLLISTAFGQYPFSDDFSNPAQTSLNWGKYYATDVLVSAQCAGGVYTITNQHTDGIPGLIYHSFTTKSSTYTASCVVTRISDTIAAGMWLNLSAFPGYSGYAVQLSQGTTACIGALWITKYVSGSPTSMFSAEYHRNSTSDIIKVSEQGNVFTVFCNGVFLGSFTDNTPVAAGDFALMVPPNNTTAVFDNVSFTNQFTPGSFPRLVIDNFNNSRIEDIWIPRGCSYFTENDSVLNISVSSGVNAFCEARMTIDTFYSRIIVSHRNGDSTPYYGFYLRGPDTTIGPLTTYPAAYFVISGNHACNAFISGVPFVPKYYLAGIVHGKAFVAAPRDTTFFKDTIDVKKTTGSNFYFLYVNGNKLDSIATSSITFSITGAGIFCGGGAGQNIFVDYFFLGPDSTATGVIYIVKGSRLVKGMKFSPMTSRYLFNPLGRTVGKRDAYGRINITALARGCYITPEGKNGIIIKK